MTIKIGFRIICNLNFLFFFIQIVKRDSRDRRGSGRSQTTGDRRAIPERPRQLQQREAGEKQRLRGIPQSTGQRPHR